MQDTVQFADFGELDLPDINLDDFASPMSAALGIARNSFLVSALPSLARHFAGIDTDTAFLEESHAIAEPRRRVVPARRICQATPASAPYR